MIALNLKTQHLRYFSQGMLQIRGDVVDRTFSTVQNMTGNRCRRWFLLIYKTDGLDLLAQMRIVGCEAEETMKMRKSTSNPELASIACVILTAFLATTTVSRADIIYVSNWNNDTIEKYD